MTPARILKATGLRAFHRLPPGMRLWLRSFKGQEPEFGEVKSLVKPGTTAVDVGANKGAYTYELARLVGRNGSVLAIEPIAELADYLSRACRQLRLPVTVQPCCVSSHPGSGSLTIPIADGQLQTGFASLADPAAGAAESRPVKVETLDRLLANRSKPVSFIKCDVEGHEMEAFEGAVGVLDTDRPNLLIEIEQRLSSNPVLERIAWFLKRGYRGVYLRDGKPTPIESFDPEQHQSLSPSRTCYVNNFIFVPEEQWDQTFASRIGVAMSHVGGGRR